MFLDNIFEKDNLKDNLILSYSQTLVIAPTLHRNRQSFPESKNMIFIKELSRKDNF